MAKRNLKADVLTSLLGGVNYDASLLDIGDDESPNCSNFLPAISLAGIESRNGFVRHNTSAMASAHVTGLAFFWIQGAVPQPQFCALSGGKFFEDVSGTWTDRTGSLTLTNQTTNLMSWDVLNNTFFACDLARDQPFTWAGNRANAVAMGGTPPVGNICISFNQRPWIFGTIANPLLGYYGGANVLNSWTLATDFLNFDEGQGSSITGVVKRGHDQMIVFKEKSMHIVERTGTSPPFNRYLWIDGIGCAGHWTIVTLTDGSIIWADSDDIYMLQGNVVKSITVHPKNGRTRLRGFFKTILDTSRLKYAVAVYYKPKDFYRLFYTRQQGSVNDRNIDYHTKAQSWWPGDLAATSCCIRQVGGVDRLMAGIAGGFVNWQDNSASDNGAAISYNWKSSWRYFKDPNIRKKYDSLYCYLNKKSNYNIQADVFLDFLGSSSITGQNLDSGTTSGAQWDVNNWDQVNFSDEDAAFEHYLPINRVAKAVQINIKHAVANEPVRINSVGLYQRILELTARTQ